MSVTDPAKQRRVEEFLRKSLLGEELVNTQFHLFSSRSVSSRRLTKPRVLCANNVLLAKSSKYFLDLLSSDVHPSEGSLSDLTDANDVPGHISIDNYGYGSDSDLDDDEEPDPKAESQSAPPASTTPPQIRIITQPKDDDEVSEDGSESVSSDMFVMSPEHPKTDERFGTINIGEAGSVTSGETAVEEGLDAKVSATQTAMRLRSLGSRHVLVKDTAFQTWYALLNYLYTDSIKFMPLRSTGHVGQFEQSLANSPEEPRCSAKSMYRLACKVGLTDLRDEAFAYIKNNLAEYNILNELSCSLVSSHPQLLEMELDVLYAHIGSPPVVAGFAALARRIADRALHHGADIIVGIHTRLLKERQPLLPTPTSPLLLPAPSEFRTPPPPPSIDIKEPPVAGTPPIDTVESPCAASTPILQYQSGVSWGQRDLDLALDVGAAFPESVPGNGMEDPYGILGDGGKEDPCGVPDNGSKDLYGIPDDGGKEDVYGVPDSGTEDPCGITVPKKKKGGLSAKGNLKKKKK